MARGDTLLNAATGAVVTVLLSFTVLSPVLGGGIAGYLQRGDRGEGARVGAISGALAAVPFLLLVVALGSLLFTGELLAPGTGTPRATALLFAVGFVFALGWNVALGTLGGYLGTYVATETDVGN